MLHGVDDDEKAGSGGVAVVDDDDVFQHLAQTTDDFWSCGSVVRRVRHVPTALEFSRMVRRNQPVVFEGLCAEWAATKTWTREYLENALGDTVRVTVSVTPNGRGDAVTDVDDSALFVPTKSGAGGAGGAGGDGGGGGQADDDTAGVAVANRFAVEEKVEANFGGHGKFYPAVVAAVNADGTFDVVYDDGDAEDRVPVDRIRALVEGAGAGNDDHDDDDNNTPPGASTANSRSRVEEEATANASRFVVGEAVEANFNGAGRFYRGAVDGVNGDGTFNIVYADGDHEDHVPEGRIRAFVVTEEQNTAAGSGSSGNGGTPTFAVGDAVEANYDGRGTFFGGRVSAVRDDGTFDVDYDDGDSERGVPSNRLRFVAVAEEGGPPTEARALPPDEATDDVVAADATNTAAAAAAAARRSRFSVDDKIEADFGGQGTFYAGRVAACLLYTSPSPRDRG